MSTQTDTMPEPEQVAGKRLTRRRMPSAGRTWMPRPRSWCPGPREQGIALTGPGGLLSGLTRQVLETALLAELTEQLGHEHREPPGPSGNIRNGYSAKTVRTEIGDVQIKVSRDRGRVVHPVMVPTCARRLTGFDEQVIGLHAKGWAPGTCQPSGQHLRLAGIQDLVSRVTDAVVAELAKWASPPLDPV